MTTAAKKATTVDVAAQASIGAAARELHLPTVRTESARLAAIVDRVTFNAHIIETGTKSYRLRTSKTTTRAKRTS